MRVSLKSGIMVLSLRHVKEVGFIVGINSLRLIKILIVCGLVFKGAIGSKFHRYDRKLEKIF